MALCPFGASPVAPRFTTALLGTFEKVNRMDTELLNACKALLGLIESGQLVRDISHDAEPGWAMKQLGLVQVLKQAQDAVDNAEKKRAA